MATVTHGESLVISPRDRGTAESGRAFVRPGRSVSGLPPRGRPRSARITGSSSITRTPAGSSGGQATDDELRHFVRQFSVFSNQFLVAALLRVINAPTLQQARSAKEILLNELGVIYRRISPGASPRAPGPERRGEGPRGRPRAGQHRGDGRRRHLPVPRRAFRMAARRGGGPRPGLRPTSASAGTAGPRRSTSATSCTGSMAARIRRIAEGASFAVENWAAAGFWQELEDGLL